MVQLIGQCTIHVLAGIVFAFFGHIIVGHRIGIVIAGFVFVFFGHIIVGHSRHIFVFFGHIIVGHHRHNGTVIAGIIVTGSGRFRSVSVFFGHICVGQFTVVANISVLGPVLHSIGLNAPCLKFGIRKESVTVSVMFVNHFGNVFSGQISLLCEFID